MGSGGGNVPLINVVGNYMPSGHDASRIVDTNGLAPTVKENHGTVTAIVEEKPQIKDFSCGEFKDLNEYIEYLKELQDQEPVEHKDLELEDGTKIRIRKLTPKECWRLMGFSDEDFERAKAVPMSNSQLYKQAGNSIVVNVLEKIFKNLF